MEPRRLATGVAVRVRVPASSANLGPGFDSIGLALGVWDEYLVALTSPEADGAPGPGGLQGALRIAIEGDPQDVPCDERHLVYATMRRAWARLGVEPAGGVSLYCANTIRQGRGMGSSAAAIVAGVGAAYALAAIDPSTAIETAIETAAVGVPVDLDAVNDLASTLEGHPDNASASVYGGATISWVDALAPEGEQVHSAAIPVHPGIEPLVLVPQIQLATATARAVLPAQVPHREAALNSASAGLLVLALSSRPDLLMAGTREWLHQEQRRSSFGGAMGIVDALRAQGHAAVISGAGPSVLVLARTDMPTDLRTDLRTDGATGRTVPEQVAGLLPSGWALLRPGIPRRGLRIERVTLEELPDVLAYSA